MKQKKSRKKQIFYYVLFCTVFLLALVIATVVGWSKAYFGVGLEQIVFTLTSPMEGANAGVVISDAFKSCLPIICPLLALYVLFVFLDYKLNLSITFKGEIFRHSVSLKLYRVIGKVISVLCVAALIASVFYANAVYDVVGYIKQKNDVTTIYEDYYVDPRSVDIVSNENGTKNLICIYLESMEASYASSDVGGFQTNNLIPNLTELANNNISFSNSQKLGGFHTVSGTSWTMGALFALNAGVPFSFPIEGNSMGRYEKFASGIVTLGDVLKQKGYNQEFLCGSNADFGGRKNFFEQHGDYKIFDYYSAIENGYIDDDYYVFWGIEDKRLYEIAKDEITNLSQSGSPLIFQC